MLTLTATPIPRTLAMSLEGIRDFSVIATAPQRRLAIKTFVRRETDGTIREAMLRELKRGGQVYFLHNEVETIENRRADAGGAGARGAHRGGARPDARARTRARDARFPPAALQRAAVHDDHRDRHRRAHRQHHRHPPRRPLRPGAAAPAARPRRALAPPGLRLPADSRTRRAITKDATKRLEAIQIDGGARFGFLPGDARPRDPRRRRGAGRVAVGRHAGSRLRAVHRDAQRGGQCAEGRPRARPRVAARRDHRDQPAPAGAAARRLLRRRARAADAVQAAGQLPDARRADRRCRRNWSTVSAGCPSPRAR